LLIRLNEPLHFQQNGAESFSLIGKKAGNLFLKEAQLGQVFARFFRDNESMERKGDSHFLQFRAFSPAISRLDSCKTGMKSRTCST
jgi:hypothetical protein